MKSNQKNIILFLVLFLIIFFLTPISGDDYGNYVSSTGKIQEAINIAIANYFSWEGRFLGRILIIFLTYHKFLWNIITAFLFTLMVSSIFKLLKNKSSYIILILGILLVNNDMFAQSYTWLAGSITYLYPMTLIFFYFIYIYKKHQKYQLYDYVILTILSIIIPLFVENIACGYVLGILLISIYFYLKERKIYKIYLINFLLSTTSLIIMILSPGSQKRALTENILFNELNIFEKILTNIPNFNNYVFFKNSTMIIITLIPIIYYLIKNNKKIISILISIIPILSIINNIYYMLPMKFEFLNQLRFLNTNNPLYLIFWIIYIILFILSIRYIIKDKTEKNFIYLLLITGISSSLVMLILPTWGDRISIYTVLTMTTIGTILIDKIIKNNQKILKPLKVVYTCIYLGLIVCFISINRINSYRETYIEKQLALNQSTIEVIRNPFMYLWNNNPQSEYFIKTYKSYMNIPKESNITIKQLPYKDYLNIIIRGKP